MHFYNFVFEMKKLLDSVLTLGKVVIKSRAVPKRKKTSEDLTDSGTLIIMGNGPSLSETIRDHLDTLVSHDTMAVNFAATTEEYFRLKPNHYILADPHFFESDHPKVETLWENISKTDWPLTLHIPSGRKIGSRRKLPENITVRRFNMTPAEGYDSICHKLFDKGLAMPRPRNVLIPAIMEGIREGYGRIYIVGADHTWPHTLYVDDLNRVVTVQPHFYKEDKEELDRIAEVYAGSHVHDVLGNMVVAFRSYHAIRRYADERGVEILNATPGSLIDAFTRSEFGKEERKIKK